MSSDERYRCLQVLSKYAPGLQKSLRNTGTGEHKLQCEGIYSNSLGSNNGPMGNLF